MRAPLVGSEPHVRGAQGVGGQLGGVVDRRLQGGQRQAQTALRLVVERDECIERIVTEHLGGARVVELSQPVSDDRGESGMGIGKGRHPA